MVTLTATPSASESAATAKRPGVCRRERRANLTSWISVSIDRVNGERSTVNGQRELPQRKGCDELRRWDDAGFTPHTWQRHREAPGAEAIPEAVIARPLGPKRSQKPSSRGPGPKRSGQIASGPP